MQVLELAGLPGQWHILAVTWYYALLHQNAPCCRYVAGDYALEQLSPAARPADRTQLRRLRAGACHRARPRRAPRAAVQRRRPALRRAVDQPGVGGGARERIEQAMPAPAPTRCSPIRWRPSCSCGRSCWPGRRRALRVAVVGDDVSAVELALAAARGGRPARQPRHAGGGRRRCWPTVQRAAAHTRWRLKSLNVTVLHDQLRRHRRRRDATASGATLACDAPLLATGGGAPAWLAGGRTAGRRRATAGQRNGCKATATARSSSCRPTHPAEVGLVLTPTCAPPGRRQLCKTPGRAAALRVKLSRRWPCPAAWGPLGTGRPRPAASWRRCLPRSDRCITNDLGACMAPC